MAGGRAVDRSWRRVDRAACVLRRASGPALAAAAGRPLALPLPDRPRPRAAGAGAAQDSARLFPPQDLGLLEAPDRDEWQKPDLIMDALGIADGAASPTSAPAAAGSPSGWRGASGRTALVYAQDIQPQMIEAIDRRVQREGLDERPDGARHADRSEAAAEASTPC